MCAGGQLGEELREHDRDQLGVQGSERVPEASNRAPVTGSYFLTLPVKCIKLLLLTGKGPKVD